MPKMWPITRRKHRTGTNLHWWAAITTNGTANRSKTDRARTEISTLEKSRLRPVHLLARHLMQLVDHNLVSFRWLKGCRIRLAQVQAHHFSRSRPVLRIRVHLPKWKVHPGRHPGLISPHQRLVVSNFAHRRGEGSAIALRFDAHDGRGAKVLSR